MDGKHGGEIQIKMRYPKNRKTGNYGIGNCVLCKKEMHLQTSNKKYCNECKKIHNNDYFKYKYQTDTKFKEGVSKRNNLWQEKNKERCLFNNGEWRKKNKTTVNARNMASKKIQLKPKCEICSSKKKLQRHHWRYDKPLMVNTLCGYCHNIQHIKIHKGVLL